MNRDLNETTAVLAAGYARSETAWGHDALSEVPIWAAARRGLEARYGVYGAGESITGSLDELLRTAPMSGPCTPDARGSIQESGRFELLQKWEGVVLSVESESFWVRLRDLTGDASEEEAEFPTRELSREEQEWLLPGAFLYWTIGYEDRNGQRRRVSALRFRRVGGAQAGDIAAARGEAQRLAEAFNWH